MEQTFDIDAFYESFGKYGKQSWSRFHKNEFCKKLTLRERIILVDDAETLEVRNILKAIYFNN